MSPFLPQTLEHFVPVGAGRTIHVTETVSVEARHRSPRRAVLMLPGPLTNGSFYNIDTEGYHAGRLLALRGVYAFTADFEGTGRSSYPDDGRAPSLASQVDAMAKVVKFICELRQVPSVDVLGESWGGAVGVELGTDVARIRTATAATMVYTKPTPVLRAWFHGAEWRAMLDGLGDGYLPTTTDTYEDLVVHSSHEVRAYVFKTQPGRYATAPFHELLELPFFRPAVCKTPVLVIQGSADPRLSIEDAADLAASFSPPARLAVLEGGGHVPRVEVSHRFAYWRAFFEFIGV